MRTVLNISYDGSRYMYLENRFVLFACWPVSIDGGALRTEVVVRWN